MSTATLEPRSCIEHDGRYHYGVTHVVTIPGTSYKAFLGDAYMLPQAKKAGVQPPRVEALLKSLARTTVKGIGKRRVKAQPLLQTIEEFQALTTAKAA
jgi:hypothetical protein